MSGLLASDDLRRILKLADTKQATWQEMDLVRGHIAALEKERDAALADNAEILRGVQEMRNLLMYPHDEWHQVAVDAIRVGNGLTAVEHPGATLLEEHSKALEARDGANAGLLAALKREREDRVKALVRARNEGLEKAAEYMVREYDQT